jgi:hypothetical protein
MLQRFSTGQPAALRIALAIGAQFILGSALAPSSAQEQVRPGCGRPSLAGEMTFLAPYERGLVLKLVCDGGRSGARRCATQFPFRGFSPQLYFSSENLPKWA